MRKYMNESTNSIIVDGQDIVLDPSYKFVGLSADGIEAFKTRPVLDGHTFTGRGRLYIGEVKFKPFVETLNIEDFESLLDDIQHKLVIAIKPNMDLDRVIDRIKEIDFVTVENEELIDDYSFVPLSENHFDEEEEYTFRRLRAKTQSHRHIDHTLFDDTDPSSRTYSGEGEELKIRRMLNKRNRTDTVGSRLDYDVDNGRDISGWSADVEDEVRFAENGLPKLKMFESRYL